MNRREQSYAEDAGHDAWAQAQVERLRDRYRREGLNGLRHATTDLLAHVTEDQAADLLTEAVLTLTEQPGPRAAGRRDWAHFDADETHAEAARVEQGGEPVSDFDPGDGWREMPRGTYAERDDDITLVLMAKGESSRRWVREVPVSPLPTKPGTVIVTGRNLIGDALAALDQSLTVADDRTGFDRDYWLQRAAVNAAVAQAQQSRLSNLIAWKQLRQSASPSTLPGSGDAITQEIEDALGITDPGADA